MPSTLASQIISTLQAHKAELHHAGIRRLSLFGSTSRGEADHDSDIDLAVELEPEAHIGLVRLAALERRLTEILGCGVDLLPEPVEPSRLRANLDRDRQRVF